MEEVEMLVCKESARDFDPISDTRSLNATLPEGWPPNGGDRVAVNTTVLPEIAGFGVD